MGHATAKIFWPRPPVALGKGQKVKYHLTDFGALGVPRGGVNFFFKHGHVTYQIDGDDEQNKMQVQFSS